MLALALGAAFACAAPKVAEQGRPTVEAPQATQVVTSDVLAETDVTVVVTKHTRRLELYRRGTLVQGFPIVLGARPMGAKRFEGDMRTPEGVYRVAANDSTVAGDTSSRSTTRQRTIDPPTTPT